MKIDDKYNNMKITLSIVGINVDLMGAELICLINDLLNKKKGLTTLRDIKRLEVNVIAKYAESQIVNGDFEQQEQQTQE